MIYLDNAATTFPKPEAVAESMAYYIREVGANVNRGVYGTAEEAELVILTLRERLCRLFGFNDPTHVVLTSGATAAMNMLLKGFLCAGDHCLVSSMEHNAVMRPLTQLTRHGVSYTRILCDSEGFLDPEAIRLSVQPNTKLLVMAHASNVSGTLQNAEAVGVVCRELGIRFVLDAAQTAGHFPIDFQAFGLSALVVPGHKGLLGPSGTGAMLLTPDFAAQLEPLLSGGTGSASDSEELPSFMPDRFEAGTPNIAGYYGLETALAYVEARGVEALSREEAALTAYFLEQLDGLGGIRSVGATDLSRRVGVVSLDFPDRDNAEIAYRLEREHGILTRCGMHCAPSAHKTLGTFPQGTVRFSLGAFSKKSDIDAAVSALRALTDR